MFSVVRKEIDWNGAVLSLETGKIARQADGAVIVTYGNTVILCTVVFDRTPSDEVDFFPLGVHYIEKPYAAGKFPGGFSKREGKPSDREVLVSRLIDRSLRPLFHEDFRNETQIICQVLSYDPNYAPEIPTIIGTSAALMISGIPFAGPVASCSVGLDGNGNFYHQKAQTDNNSLIQLVVSGTKDGIIMVESESKEVEDSKMVDAIWFAHENYQPVISMINEFASEVSREVFIPAPHDSKYFDTYNEVKSVCTPAILEAFKIREKLKRHAVLNKVLNDFLSSHDALDQDLSKAMFHKVESEILKSMITTKSIRIDGRGLDDIRPISTEIDLFNRTHGTGLFTRGETQVLSFLTLGSYSDEQIAETLEGETRESFYLHYNFPPYCVGEATKLGAVSRREIGHGKLAFKALNSVIPSKQSFPYTIRLVAEVMESNGSSSMATICASSLALMDGGVPVKSHVAGIAMGLIKDEKSKKVAVLSDIQGLEDFLGDMDFKVTGTAKGVTAIQMDIKIHGIDKPILLEALTRARIGRMYIMDKLLACIAEPRASISKYAPKIITFEIDPEKIKDVIGSGGKTINKIIAETGVKIDIEDDGSVFIASVDEEMNEKAKKIILSIVEDVEVGDVYDGKVVRTTNFGAFVDLGMGKEGMIHIS